MSIIELQNKVRQPYTQADFSQYLACVRLTQQEPTFHTIHETFTQQFQLPMINIIMSSNLFATRNEFPFNCGALSSVAFSLGHASDIWSEPSGLLHSNLFNLDDINLLGVVVVSVRFWRKGLLAFGGAGNLPDAVGRCVTGKGFTLKVLEGSGSPLLDLAALSLPYYSMPV